MDLTKSIYSEQGFEFSLEDLDRIFDLRLAASGRPVSVRIKSLGDLVFVPEGQTASNGKADGFHGKVLITLRREDLPHH